MGCYMILQIPVKTSSVSLAATIIGALILGSYTLGKDTRSGEISTLKNQVDSYIKAGSLDIPSLVKSLDQSAKQLALSKSEQDDLRKLRELTVKQSQTVNETNKLIGLKNDKISDLNKKVLELEADLSHYYVASKTFTAYEKSSVSLVKSGIALGLTRVNTSSSYAEFNIGNQKTKLSIGNSAPLEILGEMCDLRLLSVSYSSAEFQLSCKS